MNWLIEQFQTNQFLQGGALVGGGAYALNLMRSLPRTVWAYARRQFTIRLEIWNSDPNFRALHVWLATIPYADKARSISLINKSLIDGYGQRSRTRPYDAEDDDEDESPITTMPGVGRHWFFYKGRLISIDLVVDHEHSRNDYTRMKYDLTVVGRKPGVILDLMHHILALRKGIPGIPIHSYRPRYGWTTNGRKADRPISSIIQPPGTIENFLSDAREFLDSKDWYRARGIPYRRGYLLSGPPGTGKSSVVLALATELKMPVYVINLGSIEEDGDIFSAMQQTPAKSIVLLEDIDAAQHDRERVSKDDTKEEDYLERDKKEAHLSLSGLLNAIDGVGASEDRILIMTSNYPDKLDPALRRHGRVDAEVIFQNLGVSEVERMFSLFFPGVTVPSFPNDGREYNPAAMQGLFLKHKDNPLDIRREFPEII